MIFLVIGRNGLIIQWGRTSSPLHDTPISLPLNFSNTTYTVLGMDLWVDNLFQISISKSKGSFSVSCTARHAGTTNWLAIGY